MKKRKQEQKHARLDADVPGFNHAHVSWCGAEFPTRRAQGWLDEIRIHQIKIQISPTSSRSSPKNRQWRFQPSSSSTDSPPSCISNPLRTTSLTTSRSMPRRTKRRAAPRSAGTCATGGSACAAGCIMLWTPTIWNESWSRWHWLTWIVISLPARQPSLVEICTG